MTVRAAPPPASLPNRTPQALPPRHVRDDDSQIIARRPFVIARPRPVPPPASKRRSMRPRLWATVTAFALLLVLNLALQADRRHWDVRADPYFALERVQRCESLGRTPDVLYLGSSRGLLGIDPARIDSVLRQERGASVLGCNAGMFASTNEQDYYTLQRFIRDGYVPKVVVEVVWEWNLNAQAADRADTDPYHFNHVLALADAQDTPALLTRMGGFPAGLPQAADFLARRLIPLYGDRAALLQMLCGTSQLGPCGLQSSPLDPGLRSFYESASRQGWIAQRDRPLSALSDEERLHRLDITTPLMVSTLQHFTIGGQQPDWLARMIALARQHGIRVVLLQTPLHPAYYTLFPRQDDWQRVTTYWTTFAAAHGVSYYDASHLPGYTDADFVDLHHLQAAGAEKFSTWVARTIVGPTLTGGPQP